MVSVLTISLLGLPTCKIEWLGTWITRHQPLSVSCVGWLPAAGRTLVARAASVSWPNGMTGASHVTRTTDQDH